jgi:hypothetical protein
MDEFPKGRNDVSQFSDFFNDIARALCRADIAHEGEEGNDLGHDPEVSCVSC